MNKPDWKDTPEWSSCLAMNSDGEWDFLDNHRGKEYLEICNILGKNAMVRVINNNRTKIKGVRLGYILKDKDWNVGCPVFVDNETGDKLGVGYDCELISVNIDQ